MLRVQAEAEPNQDLSKRQVLRRGRGPTDSQVCIEDSADAVWEPNILVAGSSCPWGEMGPQAKYSDLDHLIEGGGISSSPSAEESLSLG